jgi:spoIIIJ-associated protein
MRSVETEGESIDQAIDKALAALSVGRERVQIEILADATRGLFGFGGSKARIRATVRAPLATRLDDAEGDATPAVAVPRGTGADADPPRLDEPPTPRPSAEGRDAGCAVSATTVLETILTHLGLRCTIETRDGEEPGIVVLEVRGDNGGLAIGRRGQTLDAVEYVVNRIASRVDESAPARFVVDVEGYRQRRRQYLTDLAHRLSDKVRQTGRAVTLNPMSPRDRRIVHLAAREETGVATRSQGEGYYRKMLILPADRARRGSRPAS